MNAQGMEHFPLSDEYEGRDIAPVPPKPVEPPHALTVTRSVGIGKLVEALCKAQLEFAPVVKANINPQFKSKYADLATIIQATMPALAKNGLVVIQSPSAKGRELTMTTMLVHSSGEWISSELTLPATMRNELTAQTIGSACTYSRRYALQSVLGIAADLDDDAQEASGGGSTAAAQAVAERKIAEYKGKKGEDPDKYADVKAALAECKSTDDLNFLLEGWRGDKALVSDQNVRSFVRSRAAALNLIFDDSSRMWVTGAK
jgi:ERF superfamily